LIASPNFLSAFGLSNIEMRVTTNGVTFQLDQTEGGFRSQISIPVKTFLQKVLN
jgi:signal transduction histidine kinase